MMKIVTSFVFILTFCAKFAPMAEKGASWPASEKEAHISGKPESAKKAGP
jgi:hypothetical protein